MNLQGLKKFSAVVVNQIKSNSPTILTAMGVAGIFGTVVLAVKATPKAVELIEMDSYAKHGDRVSYTKKEAIQSAWKCYIPTVLMGTATATCIIAANSIHLRRNAAIASMFSISEAALKEYQAKVIETIGERKEQKIYDEVVQERLDRHPLSKNEVIITGTGETLCFEVLSGRYFKSDRETLRKIENDIGRDLLTDMYVDLNDVYSKMGLSPTKLGSHVGWNVDKKFEFFFDTKIAEGGQPCLVIDYVVDPSPTFRR